MEFDMDRKKVLKFKTTKARNFLLCLLGAISFNLVDGLYLYYIVEWVWISNVKTAIIVYLAGIFIKNIQMLIVFSLMENKNLTHCVIYCVTLF